MILPSYNLISALIFPVILSSIILAPVVQPREIEIVPEKLVEVEEKTEYSKIGVVGVILKLSEEYDVDFNLAYDLAVFESQLDPTICNRQGSSACGIYQFIISTWENHCEGNRFDAYDNTKCAMKLISEGGIRHWTADSRTKALLVSKGYVK